MKTYPFFVGGPFDGERVPLVCREPTLRQLLPVDLPVTPNPDPPVKTPNRTVDYRRKVACWEQGSERAECWVYGKASGRRAQDVEMWFRCLP